MQEEGILTVLLLTLKDKNFFHHVRSAWSASNHLRGRSTSLLAVARKSGLLANHKELVEFVSHSI